MGAKKTTNTPKRSNAIFFSREFSGFRAWPEQRDDKAFGLARFANKVEGMSWIAIATRATSIDGDMLCRWVPQPDFMNFYNRGASLPSSALFQCPAAPYNVRDRRFEISSELLAAILGFRQGVAA